MANAVQRNQNPLLKAAAGIGAADKENGRRSLLQVDALWHEQVHQSRISFLSVSEDGNTLLSGCDAAAPRRVEGIDFPGALVDAKDGKVLQTFTGGAPQNIRLVLAADAGQLICVNDQGCILRLTPPDGSPNVAEQQAEGAKADQMQAEAEQGEPAADELPAKAAPEEEQPRCVEPAEANSAGRSVVSEPEFLAETGYRGFREGYLFRVGTKGMGYYRKDVVRLYAPSRRLPTAAPDAQPGTTDAVTDAARDAAAAAPPAPSATEPAGSIGAPQQPQDTVTAPSSSSTLGGGSTYLQRLLEAPPSMQSAITSHDGSLLFTASLGSKDHCIRVWRLQQAAESMTQPPQPTLLQTLSGQAASVLCLALNPQGTLLFSGSYDYTIRVWSTADWSCVRVLKGHGGGVRALAVSPDGGTLFSAAGDNTLRAWSTKLWVCLRSLHGRHEETTWPCCMTLSPDGELLASGSNGLFGGSTIKVFQTRSWQGREAGACLATFAQLSYNHKGAVSALAFSHDGQCLYSGASDGTLAAWRLNWVDPTAGGKGVGFRRGFF